MNTASRARLRRPEQVARTALAALGRGRPAVVDGRGNAALAFIFGRVLAASTAARIAKRVLPMMSDR